MRKESENSTNLIFFISDDGHGFNSNQTNTMQEKDLLNQSTHLGLQGMKTRAQLIGAKLDIYSDEDCGTEVRFRVNSNQR